MKSIREILRQFAGNRAALGMFLADSDAWIGARAAHLDVLERAELRRVAQDLFAFLELRCLERIEVTPENRCLRHRDIRRRKFMFQALSATLAGVLGVALAARAEASGPEAGAPNGLEAVATDNACQNQALCDDADGCLDVACENYGGCSNIDCTDDGCGNASFCDDMDCADHRTCNNLTNCEDMGMCMDAPCTNIELCDDKDGCIDDTCRNLGSCADDQVCGNSNCG